MENSVTPKNFCYSIQEKHNTRGLYVTDFEVMDPKHSKCMQFTLLKRLSIRRHQLGKVDVENDVLETLRFPMSNQCFE